MLQHPVADRGHPELCSKGLQAGEQQAVKILFLVHAENMQGAMPLEPGLLDPSSQIRYRSCWSSSGPASK